MRALEAAGNAPEAPATHHVSRRRHVTFEPDGVDRTARPSFTAGHAGRTDVPLPLTRRLLMSLQAFPIWTHLRQMNAEEKNRAVEALTRWVKRSGILDGRPLQAQTLVAAGLFKRHKWLTHAQVGRIAENLERAVSDRAITGRDSVARAIRSALWPDAHLASLRAAAGAAGGSRG